MTAVHWPRLARCCVETPLPRLLDVLAGELGEAVAGLDLWLWDHHHQQVRSLRTGQVRPASAVEQPDGVGVVPVVHLGDELGVLTADASGSGVLEGLAPLLAAAVRAGEPVVDALVTARRRQQMSLPAEIQWSLLPPPHVSDARLSLSAAVEPAYETGGDVFDYTLDRDRVFLAVLDAMGHGLRASVTSALAVGAMRRARRNGEDLEAAAEAVGRAVIQQGNGEEYVSAVFVELDPDTGEGRWLSAGHLPPLIAGARGVAPLPLRPSLPLGLEVAGEISRPVVQPLTLAPDETLVLYSDGMVDNIALGDGDPVGDLRFHEALRRHVGSCDTDPAPAVVGDLLGLTGPQLRDDATIMFVQRHR